MRTPVYPVYVKFAVTSYMFVLVLVFQDYNNDAFKNEMTVEVGLRLTISVVFCL